MHNSEKKADYDSPWKEALDLYFEEFIGFFFPKAYRDIDWDKGYEFMDKEFQQIVRDAEVGKRLADQLVKVWRKDGKQTLVMVHIEVQSQYESDFAERMFVYNYRIFDRYRLPVATLVVLADDRPSWRPNNYQYEMWDSEMGLKFPVVKLLDYESQWSMLESSTNPFAVMVMAHLKTQATNGNPLSRLQWKLTVAKSLYQRGYSRQDILELFRLINWMMTLPEELEQSFTVEITNYEEEKKMPYITPLERFAIERGRQQGIAEGMIEKGRESVIEILETRFDSVPTSLVETINQIENEGVLKILFKRAIMIASLAEFEEFMNQQLSEFSAENTETTG